MSNLFSQLDSSGPLQSQIKEHLYSIYLNIFSSHQSISHKFAPLFLGSSECSFPWFPTREKECNFPPFHGQISLLNHPVEDKIQGFEHTCQTFYYSTTHTS